MMRPFWSCAFTLCLTSFAPAANLWLSVFGDVEVGSAPPSTIASIPRISHHSGQGGGTFYVWARPTTDKTLANWSLNVVSTNPAVLTLRMASVEAYNPVLGSTTVQGATVPVVRWEAVDEPDLQNPLNPAIEGANIFGLHRVGKGIGPETDGVQSGPVADQYDDPFYNPDTDSWLLASVNYTLTGVEGETQIYLQTGNFGMSHTEDAGCTSGGMPADISKCTSIVYGFVDDDPLNALDDRFARDEQTNNLIESPPGTGIYLGVSSDTPELYISYSAAAQSSADFDADGDVDGRDFLTWQRGYGIASGAHSSQGDANGDGAVNGTDLQIWQEQYGRPLAQSVAAHAVPEPTVPFATILVACVATSNRCRRFRVSSR